MCVGVCESVGVWVCECVWISVGVRGCMSVYECACWCVCVCVRVCV